MINLSNITLVTIDGIGNNLNCLKALKYSSTFINFKNIKFFSPVNPSVNSFYEYVQIPKLSYDDYSKFCLVDLPDYIDTEFVLIIHDDGFICNPHLWSDEFLNYDYIGAMWPQGHLFENSKRWPFVHQKYIESKFEYIIGNGGFCLRSKKLIDKVKKLYKDEYYGIPEDVLIGIGFRKELEENNIKFANYDIASKFSCETTHLADRIIHPSNTFGFHGRDTYKNLIKVLDSVSL